MDYLTLVVVLRGLYVGYKSGLFPEILRIAAYVVTVLVTVRFYEPAAQFLTLKTFLNETTATGLAFVGLLAATFLVTKLVTMILLKVIKSGDGGFPVKLLGAILGACRWVILLSFVFMAIERSPMSGLKADIKDGSVVGSKLSKIGPMLFDFLAKVSPELGFEKEA